MVMEQARIDGRMLMCCWDRRGYVLGRARAADVSRELRGPPVEERRRGGWKRPIIGAGEPLFH